MKVDRRRVADDEFDTLRTSPDEHTLMITAISFLRFTLLVIVPVPLPPLLTRPLRNLRTLSSYREVPLKDTLPVRFVANVRLCTNMQCSTRTAVPLVSPVFCRALARRATIAHAFVYNRNNVTTWYTQPRGVGSTGMRLSTFTFAIASTRLKQTGRCDGPIAPDLMTRTFTVTVAERSYIARLYYEHIMGPLPESLGNPLASFLSILTPYVSNVYVMDRIVW